MSKSFTDRFLNTKVFLVMTSSNKLTTKFLFYGYFSFYFILNISVIMIIFINFYWKCIIKKVKISFATKHVLPSFHFSFLQMKSLFLSALIVLWLRLRHIVWILILFWNYVLLLFFNPWLFWLLIITTLVYYMTQHSQDFLFLLSSHCILLTHYLLNYIIHHELHYSSWLICESIEALEIKTSVVFNIVFASNTILSCFYTFSWWLTYNF